MMQALVYEGPRQMVIREQERPQVAADELLIKVELAGICGSELSGYLGQSSLRIPPLVMGHEFSGTVESRGSQVTAFQHGDRVTVNPLITCGRCRYCTSRRSQLCPSRKLMGAHCPGAYANYISVPARNAYRLPDTASFVDGALVEPFACAVHVLRLLAPHPLDRLLVLGAGPIGLMIVRAAQLYGLRDISVIDLSADRLTIAAELGATTAHSIDQLPVQAPFMAAVDAVGVEATRRAAVDAVENGGQVIFTGLHTNDTTFAVNDCIRREIRMQGAFAYDDEDFVHALNWICEGHIDFSPWIAYAPLSQGAASFERLLGNPGRIAKIMLTMDL